MLERHRYEYLRQELKNARVQAALHQVDLAKRLNKPQSYISKVESGERNIDVIEYINYCHALGINPSKHLKQLVIAFED